MAGDGRNGATVTVGTEEDAVPAEGMGTRCCRTVTQPQRYMSEQPLPWWGDVGCLYGALRYGALGGLRA